MDDQKENDANLKNKDNSFKGRIIQKGEVRNPKGRPVGSRNHLSQKFISALHADFEEYGEDVIVSVRKESPVNYLKIIAGIIPKDFNLTVSPLDGMTGGQLENTIALLGALIAKAEAGDIDLGSDEFKSLIIDHEEG